LLRGANRQQQYSQSGQNGNWLAQHAGIVANACALYFAHAPFSWLRCSVLRRSRHIRSVSKTSLQRRRLRRHSLHFTRAAPPGSRVTRYGSPRRLGSAAAFYEWPTNRSERSPFPSNGEAFCIRFASRWILTRFTLYETSRGAREHSTWPQRVRMLRRLPHQHASSFDTRTCYA
jgi:hypothetical protein